MSGDPRDYYSSSRSDDRGRLPPLREIVGDALDRSPVSPYSFDFHDVNRALPGSSKSYGRYQSPSAFFPQRGPTLPPIRRAPPSRSHSSHRARSPSAETAHQEQRRSPPDASAGYPYQTVRNPQPVTAPVPYSFNVLRAQQGDLVDVRTPSTRAQGILRPTAIIDDEDESHKRYKCDWEGCEKKYDRPSSLEVHRHTHTGTQPYPCLYPGCQRAFNVKSNMLRHFRSHPKPTTPQASGKQEEQESDSEDEEDKWPADTATVGYFHTPSSSSNRPSSSSTTHSTSKKSGEYPTPSPATQYYSSSRHR